MTSKKSPLIPAKNMKITKTLQTPLTLLLMILFMQLSASRAGAQSFETASRAIVFAATPAQAAEGFKELYKNLPKTEAKARENMEILADLAFDCLMQDRRESRRAEIASANAAQPKRHLVRVLSLVSLQIQKAQRWKRNMSILSHFGGAAASQVGFALLAANLELWPLLGVYGAVEGVKILAKESKLGRTGPSRPRRPNEIPQILVEVFLSRLTLLHLSHGLPDPKYSLFISSFLEHGARTNNPLILSELCESLLAAE